MPIDPATAAQAGIGVIQSGIGLVQSISGNARLKRLMRQRTAYQTPDEVFDMRNMALNQAQTGYDASTLSYLTNQQDKSLSTSLGSLAKLGGDPNDVSHIFGENVAKILQTAADSELIKLQKFTKVYDTVSNLAKEKTAEWADKEAILKDKMAAEAMKVAAGNKNLQSGINMGIGAIANAETNKLYKDRTEAMKPDMFGAFNEIPAVRRIERQEPEPLAPTTQTTQPSYDELLNFWSNQTAGRKYKF